MVDDTGNESVKEEAKKGSRVDQERVETDREDS